MAETFAQVERECSIAKQTAIYRAAAECFKGISPRYQEGGLGFPEEAGAFSCLQLVLLWRAVEYRLSFSDHSALKCN